MTPKSEPSPRWQRRVFHLEPLKLIVGYLILSIRSHTNDVQPLNTLTVAPRSTDFPEVKSVMFKYLLLATRTTNTKTHLLAPSEVPVLVSTLPPITAS
jgi:hypothetical protein